MIKNFIKNYDTRIISENFNLDELLKQRLSYLSNNLNTKKSILFLTPTMFCQGLCEYCYQKDYLNNDIKIISLEKLKKSLIELKYIQKVNFNEQSRLALYDGESIFACKKILDYINIIEYYLDTNIVKLSWVNGLLYKDKVFNNYIKELEKIIIAKPDTIIDIPITIDYGTLTPPRQSKVLEITYELLYKRAKIISSVSDNIHLRVFSNIDLNNDSELYYNQLKNLFNEIPNANLFLNIASYDYINLSIETCHEKLDIIFSTLRKLIKEGYGNNINFKVYTDKLKNCGYKKIGDKYAAIVPKEKVFKNTSNLFCDKILNVAAINPKGEISFCHSGNFFEKHLDSLLYTEHWYNSVKFNKELDCFNCEIFAYCNGSCSQKHTNYSIEHLFNKAYCKFKKEIIKHIHIINSEEFNFNFDDYFNSLVEGSDAKVRKI